MSVILTGDWPLTTEKVGARIGQLTQAGYVRHDILVNKAAVGRLIGARGTTLQALMESTRCEIFILDKEGPPPGCSPEQRLVVVMGGDAGQVAAAAAEVENVRTSGYPAASVGEPQAYSAAAAGIGPPTAPWDAQQQQYQQAANPQQMPAMQGCQQMQQSYMQQMQPAQMGAQMGAAPQMQPQAAGMQMAAASGAASECILTGDWPLTTDKCGARIAQLMRMGHVRHDMLILKAQVGRIIGVRGSTLQALLHSTQCEIFMLDKEGAPPGCTPEQRLVVLMGNEAQVANGVDQIKNILNGGRAPQVPPLHQQQSPGFGSYQAQYQPQQTYQQQTYQQAYQPQQYQQQSAYQQQTYEQQYQQQYQGQYQQQYQQQQYQQPQQYQQQAYPQQQQQFQPQQFQPQQYQQQAYAQPAATFQQQQGGYQQAQAGYGGANGSFGSFDAGNNGQYAFGAAQAFAPPQQRALLQPPVMQPPPQAASALMTQLSPALQPTAAAPDPRTAAGCGSAPPEASSAGLASEPAATMAAAQPDAAQPAVTPAPDATEASPAPAEAAVAPAAAEAAVAPEQAEAAPAPAAEPAAPAESAAPAEPAAPADDPAAAEVAVAGADATGEEGGGTKRSADGFDEEEGKRPRLDS